MLIADVVISADTALSSGCDGNNPEGDQKPILFDFSQCGATVKRKDWLVGRFMKRTSSDVVQNYSDKIILTNVSGQVCCGELLAVMGPSGSGKTTLLNLISLTPSTSQTVGEVRLGGKNLSSHMFSQFCAFVPQEDHLYPVLTCREALMFAADFYMTLPKREKELEVDSLLKELGLEKCKDTICGNNFLKGLSGGQKRRLSLAIALIKKPLVLFLDEPTSGLDSAAASGIMVFLQQYVERHKIAVICTIHQPSTAIFKRFHSTMILCDGRIAYSGPPSEAVGYFQSLGAEMPDDCSPAEYVLEIINSDFGDSDKKETVERILHSWKGSEQKRIPQAFGELTTPSYGRLSFAGQVWVHLRRQTLLSWRDPTLYLSRVFMFLVACILFAWVYQDTRSRTQEQVINRIFLCGWMLAVPTCLTVVAVYGLHRENLEARREIKDGMYSPAAYLVGNALVQAPYMVVLAAAALGMGAYAVGNFNARNFGAMLGAFAAALWAFENIAQALSLLPSPLAGMLVYICLWCASFLVSGVFIREESLRWPPRLFMYISPLRWSMPSIVRTEFLGTTFEGAVAVAAPAPGAPAYACAAGAALCFGRTGEEVLETVSKTFTTYGPADTLARDVAVTVGIGLGFKALFVALFLASTRRAAQPSPPVTPSEHTGRAGTQWRLCQTHSGCQC